jgi:hypothetical protein
MSTDKTYTCKICATVYAELPDNGDGEFQCGNCLSIDCFEERESSEIEINLLSILYQLLDVMQDLNNCLKRLSTIAKQVIYLQSDLHFSRNKKSKPE